METANISDVITNYTDEENEMLAKEMQAASDNQSNVSSAMIDGSQIEMLKRMGYKRKGITLVNDYNVGRNDPCPCGSGLKFKKCCMGTGRYQTKHQQ